MLGEYISAAFWGALSDQLGPRILSFSAAVLFGTGYGLMAHGDARGAEMQRLRQLYGENAAQNGGWVPTGPMAMAFYFVLVGAGVAASYFSAVSSSTRLFPAYPSIAIAIPLTLFSLSSLFLTTLGSHFFVDERSGDLNASAFLTFLAILLAVTNLISTFGMRVPPLGGDDQRKPVRKTTLKLSRRAQAAEENERTPLLRDEEARHSYASTEGAGAGESAIAGASTISLIPKSDSLADFLATPSVWVLALLMFTAVGGSEMVMSSVGNMVVSLLGKSVVPGPPLPSPPGVPPGAGNINTDALKWRSLQVQLLATANTLARLVSGVLADFLSPSRPRVVVEDHASQKLPRRVWNHLNNIRVSRMTLLLYATASLSLTFAFAATLLSDLKGLIAVSILVGTAYGAAFTLVPSIVASAFGLKTFGRSWGLLSYACAAGSLGFSLLYAVVSDAVGESTLAKATKEHEKPASTGICLQGRACFSFSFALAAIGTAIATVAAIPLWRRWHQHL